ncbi:MAG: hypothetical protein KF781_09300 [Chitinophagaceae bacterium]|nr:hypothetical protein [Chitinophagaceae bacterium]MCW5904989.1 hypothetical protein [Chitinophagaceae bacterium]
MHNSFAMEQHFERNKNIQATTFTILVTVSIFLIFFYIRWTLPMVEKPLLSEGIEVNIGNSDVGSGDIQPLVPGEPGTESNTNNNTPPTPSSVAPTTSDNTDNNDPDAVPTNNTTTTKKEVKPAVTTPTPPKPKTVMPKYSGGTGTGGNNADNYNDSRSEGNDPSGTGDKGKPWGSIDGTVYDGPGGTKVYGLGKRKITHFPTFTDDFSENAKVAVNIIVDKNGNVTYAAVNPNGTSTANKQTRAVALRRAKEIKFESSGQEQRGTIILDMRVTG